MLRCSVLEVKGVWKGYEDTGGFYFWILKELNLEFLEGEFVSILGKSGAGKTTLLKILSFLEPPDKGEIYFQGRLVGKSGKDELKQMREERIWLMTHPTFAKTPSKNLSVVLMDEPSALLDSHLDSKPGNRLLTYILYLNSCGVTVILATQSPKIASHANSIYKLNKGKLKKLTNANT